MPQSHNQAVNHFDWLDRFEPHPLWRGGWLQTASIKTLRPKIDVSSHPGCVAFDVPDDQTPPDTLSGYYLPPEDDSQGKPTVIVFHGMGGHAKSGYMRSMAECLLKDGFPVILWNNRGAGGSARTCQRFHHPGYTEDCKRLIHHLHENHPSWTEHGLNAVAFSLGANLLLKYLAETCNDSAFSTAVSVSAPIDMKITSQNLRRGWNRVFDRYLLKRQKQELLRPNAELNEEEREAIKNASSVWELDDKFTSRRLGYDGAEAFYRDNSAIDVLDQICTPTLLFHAADDPVVDEDVFTKRDWNPEGPLFAAFAHSGGHTGFIDREGRRWHERNAVRFFHSQR
ncbi:putative hydrolase [Stieleria neptunia]|uniref:Putative hydrolase n=1 Tax=Stieleria neptunia TaxID=2527979 RepID=A0A518I2X4_9BACT|nr:alpha/beta fold hydrolase [Stieleria neptunia]QDV47463.1 putative hydrolase [Stieleria neptunia]